jgi:hypothetical protein
MVLAVTRNVECIDLVYPAEAAAQIIRMDYITMAPPEVTALAVESA